FEIVDSRKVRRSAGIRQRYLGHQWSIDAGLRGLERIEETVGAEVYLVRIVAAIKVGAVVTDVADRQHCVLQELMLNAEAPLRDGRSLHLRVGDGERGGAR